MGTGRLRGTAGEGATPAASSDQTETSNTSARQNSCRSGESRDSVCAMGLTGNRNLRTRLREKKRARRFEAALLPSYSNRQQTTRPCINNQKLWFASRAAEPPSLTGRPHRPTRRSFRDELDGDDEISDGRTKSPRPPCRAQTTPRAPLMVCSGNMQGHCVLVRRGRRAYGEMEMVKSCRRSAQTASWCCAGDGRRDTTT
jgi:hypothetical protein